MQENEEMLQNNDTDVIETSDVAEPEASTIDDEQASASATDSDTKHEAKAGGESQSMSKIHDRIGELTRKRHEAERLADERLKQLQEMEQKLFNYSEPYVPDLPDPDAVSEQEFKEKLRQRDQAIKDKIAWDQQKTQHTQQHTQQQQQQQLAKQQELAIAAQKYDERAKKLKIPPEKLQQYGQVLAQAGLSNDMAEHILNDELGPAITQHIVETPDAFQEVLFSNPLRAAAYIESVVKPKLQPAKRQTQAPPPVKKKTGTSGNISDKYGNLGVGVTFE